MEPGDRVLVRPFFHIPVRPWWTESYQSPFYYPATVTKVNEQRGRAHVELDESLYPTPWQDHIQVFHVSDIHRYGCRCQELPGPAGTSTDFAPSKSVCATKSSHKANSGPAGVVPF